MNHIASRFITAYESAESSLAVLDFDDVVEHPPGGMNDADAVAGANEGDEDNPGLSELATSLESQIQGMTGAADNLGSALDQFSGSTDSGPVLSENPSPRDIQTWSLNLARQIARPAIDVDTAGEELFSATMNLNSTILRFYQIAQELPKEMGFLESYREMIEPLGTVGETKQVMMELLEAMRPAEYISVPIRKALRPFRQGVTKVSDAIAIIEGWPEFKKL